MTTNRNATRYGLATAVTVGGFTALVLDTPAAFAGFYAVFVVAAILFALTFRKAN